MPPLDVSVVLNIYRHPEFFQRTMLSLEEAVAYAASEGLRIELVVVLDRSDDATRDWIERYDASAFEAYQCLTVDNGSLGLSRNDGIAVARGEYILTYDSDDLVSFNFISAMHTRALELGPDSLIFPEYLMAFGENPHLARYYGEGVYSKLAFLNLHPFISRVLGHRSAFGTRPYAHVPVGSGFAYEDWHFNATAVARGVRMEVAPHTVLFYRQRPGSLLSQKNSLSTKQIPLSLLHKPEIFRAVCAQDYERYREGDNARPSQEDIRRDFLDDHLVLEASRAANGIDTAVDITLVEQSAAFSNLNASLGLGAAYYEAAGLLAGRTFTDVVLLPFLTTGGGEKYILNVLDALATLDPDRRFLVLTGEGGVQHEWLDRLPPDTLFLDLFNRFPSLNAEDRYALTLRIIQASAPDADVHIKTSIYGVRFFRAYGHLLSSNRNVFYRFSDQVVCFRGMHLTRGFAFDFISDNLANLDLIVTDNQTIMEEDRRKVGMSPEKWATIYTLCNPHSDSSSLHLRSPSRRLLWASRLDPEKRPELLAKLARRLHDHFPDVAIDVWGRPVFGGDVADLSEQPNVRMRGEFWSFAELKPQTYDAFLYTTAYDGLPNVVLEALSSGLPVIAPSVGGLAEVVISGSTGVLVDNDADDEVLIQSYLDAISTILADPERTAEMGFNAARLIDERHARLAFLERVATVFGVQARPAAPTESTLHEATAA